MKKILVTGATGFIGNYVIAGLLQQKNCTIIASSSTYEKASSANWFSSVEYISFNLKDFDNSVNYFKFFNEPDMLIHLAWEGLPNYKASFHIEVNLPRHYNFLKNLVDNGLADITITGTGFEYGMQEDCLSEDMEAKPSNPYAIAKDALHKKLMEFQEAKLFQLKWVRLFYIYGKGQSSNSLLSQLDKSLLNGDKEFNMSGGEQERDYLPVEKVAEYISKIAQQNKVSGTINCCSGIPVKIKSFVEDYLSANRKNIQLNLGFFPYTDYEPMSFWGDTKKLKTIINNA